jgi:CubicO group peptidase (beta-lactamase class C family)
MTAEQKYCQLSWTRIFLLRKYHQLPVDFEVGIGMGIETEADTAPDSDPDADVPKQPNIFMHLGATPVYGRLVRRWRSSMRSLRAVVSTAVLMLALPAAISQSPAIAAAVDVARIKAYIEPTMKIWNIPGAAVGIVKEGQVVFLEGFGKRDMEKSLPATPRTRFILGSTTKAFTSMALGLLVDDRKLSWDQPIASVLPDFRLQDEYASLHASARDLASHRTGLPRHDMVWINSPMDLGELVHSLRFLEPSRELRTAYQYNNLMYISLGYLVERVSGLPWDAFLRERIFQPLGMSDSGCTIPEYTASAEYAFSYRSAGNKAAVQPLPLPSDKLMYGARASGSVNTTAGDMCKWMLLHLNNGRVGDKPLISATTLMQMHTPQIATPWNPNQRGETLFPSYGLGWMLDVYRGHYRVHHGGSTLDFNSYVMLFPYSQTGVAVLINANTPGVNALVNGIADLAMGMDPIDWNKRLSDQNRAASAGRQQTPPASGTHPAHKIEDYAGEYNHPAYGTLRVEAVGATLSIRFHGYTSPLEHWHYDTFSISVSDLAGTKLTFQTNARGEIASVSASLEPTVKEIVFMRTARDAQSAAPPATMNLRRSRLSIRARAKPY